MRLNSATWSQRSTASARHRGKGRPSPGRPEEAARPAATGRSWPHGLTGRGSRPARCASENRKSSVVVDRRRGCRSVPFDSCRTDWVTLCLQRAGRLWHNAADLALFAMQDRLLRQGVGCRCGQDCGQRLACPIPRSERRSAASVLVSRSER